MQTTQQFDFQIDEQSCQVGNEVSRSGATIWQILLGCVVEAQNFGKSLPNQKIYFIFSVF